MAILLCIIFILNNELNSVFNKVGNFLEEAPNNKTQIERILKERGYKCSLFFYTLLNSIINKKDLAAVHPGYQVEIPAMANNHLQ